MTFQNICSSMADFRAVDRGCHAARLIKARRIFVAVRKRLIDNEPSWLFDCHRMPTLKQRLRLQIDWRQKKGRSFQFNLFLWVILHILHST